MKITVFTSNRPRHIALIETMAAIAEKVYVVQECNTVFPGQVKDFFNKSEIMQRYFEKVMAAEDAVFGGLRFVPDNVTQLVLKCGDLNLLSLKDLGPALTSDFYVVFGASFIRGALCEFLAEHRAINIHMGVSPYYRGNSCNFWALYDNKPDYVGATIHLLTKGLDSGPMLFHALPAPEILDGFTLGMKAVKAAHLGLSQTLKTGEIFKMEPVPQNKSLQIRYTKNQDFTDEVAATYLDRLPSPMWVEKALRAREVGAFLNPRII